MLNEPRAVRPTGRATPLARPRHSGQLRDGLEFLRGFLRHPARVGSVVPSSRWLEQRLVREARVAEAHTVVELGPGTGGTTAAFLRAMPPAAQLLAIELDAHFYQHLRITLQDPRFTLELGSAGGWKTCWPLAAYRCRMPSSPAFRFQPWRPKPRTAPPRSSPKCCARRPLCCLPGACACRRFCVAPFGPAAEALGSGEYAAGARVYLGQARAVTHAQTRKFVLPGLIRAPCRPPRRAAVGSACS